MKTLLLLIITIGGTVAFLRWRDEQMAQRIAPEAERPATKAAPAQGQEKVTNFVLRNGTGDLVAAQRRLEEAAASDPAVEEVHATIERHLSSGHLLVSGAAFDPKLRAASTKLFAIFGFPDAGQIADGEKIDCYARRLETMTVGGVTVLEYLCVPTNGRRLPRFGSYTPNFAAAKPSLHSKPGDWMRRGYENPLERR